jgi:hypothetical protein
MIVPYNKDKLALGQLKMARHLIDNVANVCAIAEKWRLLVSLQATEEGRTATIIKRQASNLTDFE